MKVIHARNVHEALPLAVDLLLTEGTRRDSRNGPVYVMDCPVTTEYAMPEERVLFWPERDANPFFHLMEALWMLGGRRDVKFVAQFAGNMASYSDDGKDFHAAYGHRWRKAFRFDQLKAIASNLRANKEDRRQILGVWSPELDMSMEQGKMKDLPCNTTAHFQINDKGSLDMTVFCRSNDIVWGCYGANAVHWSMLQEYMAFRCDVSMGRYWQVSSNWHGYVKTLEPLRGLPYLPSPYYLGNTGVFPLLQPGERADVFDQDVDMFLDEGANVIGYRSMFIRKVAVPVLQAWRAYKDQKHAVALEILDRCLADDWRMACQEWVVRRRERQLAKQAG